MRLRHRGRKPIERARLQQPDPGFTPYECISIYWLNEHGVSQREIAGKLDVSQSTIWRAIQRGKAAFIAADIPRLNVLIGDYNQPGNPRCQHNHPIRVGDDSVCCVCFVSGHDEKRKLQITAADKKKLKGEPEPVERKSFAERMHGKEKSKK